MSNDHPEYDAQTWTMRYYRGQQDEEPYWTKTGTVDEIRSEVNSLIDGFQDYPGSKFKIEIDISDVNYN